MLGADEVHEHADEAHVHVEQLSRERERTAEEPHGRKDLGPILGRVQQRSVERAVLLHQRLGPSAALGRSAVASSHAWTNVSSAGV
eukprot:6902905-Prymnesium_polylepis.1